jgi:hypothetical protein
MGHTIWVDVCDRPKGEDDCEDCSVMHRLQAHLDGLCKTLNVRKLSEFYDYSELERAYAAFDEGSESASESPPGHPKDAEGVWFDSGQGLAAMRALREHFTHNPHDLGFELDSSRQHWPERLMEELKHCEALLEKAVSNGRQFRLLIVP